MKITNLIFSILFVLFALLQYNDPDPYLWIPIYLYAAILCWLSYKGKNYPKAYLLGILCYSVYAAYLIFTHDGVIDWYAQHNAENLVQTMKAEKPWIEDTREFGGLLILIVALSLNYRKAKRSMLAS
jgi:hypothetical protein